MNPVNRAAFVDTAFFVGLIDPRDAYADQAHAVADNFGAIQIPLVTTTAVLIEVGNYFARSPHRAQAIKVIESVRASPMWEVVELTHDLIARAEQRYRRFADKNWSLTDCISMEAMADRRIRQVATTDRGFEQAGFDVLMD